MYTFVSFVHIMHYIPLQCLFPFVNVSSGSGPLKCSLDTDGDGLPDHVVRIVCVLYCACVANDCT